jgi:tripartite-type tricarboxylate transporter receptor subunit TctC
MGLLGEVLVTSIVFQFEGFCYFHFDAERGSSNASGRRSCRMRVPRFAAHIAAIVVLAVIAAPTPGQEWPSGTVRVVVPYAAGGPVDVPARLLIDRLAAQTKGVFILENRPGAGGSIGLQAVVQAPPDGATLLLTTSSVTMVPTIYPKLAFDPLHDLTSISLVTEVPISLAVRAASPFRDLADLSARAKAEPGKYTFGSGGVGTGNHLAGELLKKLAGIDLLHVPFRGVAPALTALYAGDIDMLFASTVETVSHARDRRIRVLGVGSTQPIPELPGSPAISDLVPSYVAINWYALFGPRGLPAGVLARLQSELLKAREDAVLKERAAALGMTMMLLPADALRTRMETEVPRWKQIIPEIGLKIE